MSSKKLKILKKMKTKNESKKKIACCFYKFHVLGLMITLIYNFRATMELTKWDCLKRCVF